MYGTYESQEHYEHEMGAGEAESQAAAEYEYQEHLNRLLEEGEHELWALEICANKLDRFYPEAAKALRMERMLIVDARNPKPTQSDGHKPTDIEDDLPF